MVSIEQKETLKKLGIDSRNMGCSAAQIVVLTYHIKSIASHLESNKKDFAAQKSLQCLLGKRRSLLRYCARRDNDTYQRTIKALGLRR